MPIRVSSSLQCAVKSLCNRINNRLHGAANERDGDDNSRVIELLAVRIIAARVRDTGECVSRTRSKTSPDLFTGR